MPEATPEPGERTSALPELSSGDAARQRVDTLGAGTRPGLSGVSTDSYWGLGHLPAWHHHTQWLEQRSQGRVSRELA